MATPDQVNKLTYDDQQSYEFILETQGTEQADFFLNKKLEDYQVQEASQLILQQEEAQKAQRSVGNEPAPPVEGLTLTPEQQEQARQSIQNYMQQRGVPERTFPGINQFATPEEEARLLEQYQDLAKSGRQYQSLGLEPPADALEAIEIMDEYERRGGFPAKQVPMEEVVTLRRERIPSAANIQTQAEQVQQDISTQAVAEGRPSRLGIERTLYDAVVRDYEQKNGPIADLDPATQRLVIVDMQALARERAAQYPTAEGRAEELVGGEFGAQRPRQAGSPYESPPTPRVIPRTIDITDGTVGGDLLADPESARDMSYMVDLNPFMEGETDLGSVAAIMESIKPQTIVTAPQRQQQVDALKVEQNAFVNEMTQQAMAASDNYALLSPQDKQSAIDRQVRKTFRDFYEQESENLYNGMVQRGINEEQARQSANYNAAVRTREQLYLLPDDNPMFFIIRDEMQDEFGFTGALGKSGYAPFAIKSELTSQAMDIGGSLLQDLATEETPFTGEITESIGMTLLRNINLPFRVVLNPIEEVVENTIGGGSVPAPESQKVQSFYDVKTYDFTEDVTGGVSDYIDAYLREVAVENARAYGMGNAFANYTNVEGASDALFVGGTAIEILMPWGAIAKGMQKGATTVMPINKLARMAELGADARNLTKVGQASGKANIYEVLKATKPSGTFGYIESSYSMNNKIAMEAARQMEAVDAARQYAYYMSKGDADSAAQIVAKMADDPLQNPIFQTLIDGNDFQTLNKLVDDIATQDTIYGDIAKEIVREGRVDIVDDAIRTNLGPKRVSPDGGIGRVDKGGATVDQLTGRAAERLAKFNIEDYVAFTDRMSVQKEVLKAELPFLNDAVKGLYAKPAAQILDDLPTGKLLRRDPEYKSIYDKIYQEVAPDAGDSQTQKITDILGPQEQMYLMNRYSEDWMMKKLASQDQRGMAFFQTRKDTARTMLPDELRSEAGAAPFGAENVERLTRGQNILVGVPQDATGRVGSFLIDEGVGPAQIPNLVQSGGKYVATLNPAYAARTIAETGEEVAKMAPSLASKTESRIVNRALDQANQSVVRLERALPEAMSRYGKFSKDADEAISSMYIASLTGDATRILRMSDDAAKQLGKSGQVSVDDVMEIMEGVFPSMTARDKALIAGRLRSNGSDNQYRALMDILTDPKEIEQFSEYGTDIATFNTFDVGIAESIAMDIARDFPRLRADMVGVPVAGATAPDVAKVMLAISGNNSAKARVIDVARRELSPLSVPINYYNPAAEEFIFKQAQKYLQTGVIPDRAYLTTMSPPELRVVNDLRRRVDPAPPGFDTRVVRVDELQNDIIDVANQMKARGLELGMSPEQVGKQVQNNVQEILKGEDIGQQIVGVGTNKELQKLSQLYSDPGSFRAISSNAEELSKTNPGLMNWTMRTMGMTAGDIRRSFVSGQLGGKYIPNARYVVENAVTAPVMSAVTAPGATRVMLKSYVNTPSPFPANKVRTIAQSDKANDLLPGTRYTYAQVNEALNNQNLGSTAQNVNLGDLALEDLRQAAIRDTRGVKNIPWVGDIINETYEQFRYMAKNPGFKTSSSSPGMRLAMNTDYYFRENLFIGALQDGKTIDQAAALARNAYLDYGKLPQWSKESWFRGALYFSFMYRTSIETAKAMANPKAAANLARLARGHVAMTKATGSYYFTGDQALESMFVTSQGGDGEYDGVNLYYRDPWVSNMITQAEAITFLTQAASGDPEAAIGRSIEGVLDYMYMPAIDVIRDLDPDYKKGVPPKTMYRILLAQQIAGNIPEIFPNIIADDSVFDVTQANIPQGASYYIDRYDLEVRPPSAMVPGSPTYDGYQYRFQTKEGYNNFYLDSLFLATIGAKRLADDVTAVMIQSGYLPDGAEFGYLENGSPVLYLMGRQSPMRLPKEWEMYDRQMRAQQQRLRELKKTYGEPRDTKAGDQK